MAETRQLAGPKCSLGTDSGLGLGRLVGLGLRPRPWTVSGDPIGECAGRASGACDRAAAAARDGACGRPARQPDPGPRLAAIPAASPKGGEIAGSGSGSPHCGESVLRCGAGIEGLLPSLRDCRGNRREASGAVRPDGRRADRGRRPHFPGPGPCAARNAGEDRGFVWGRRRRPRRGDAGCSATCAGGCPAGAGRRFPCPGDAASAGDG